MLCLCVALIVAALFLKHMEIKGGSSHLIVAI